VLGVAEKGETNRRARKEIGLLELCKIRHSRSQEFQLLEGSEMPEPKIITASLEGMRVLVDEKQCELQEYNFATNQWISKDASPWPLPRGRADQWLAGWNGVDRFAAISALTKAPEYPAPQRAGRRAGEPKM
jgi:hypothetical protein